MPTDALVPVVDWSQWAMVGITIIVFILSAIGFWRMFTSLQKFYREQTTEMLLFHTQQSAQWQTLIREIQKPIDDVTRALAELSKRIDSGFAGVQNSIEKHDEQVERRVSQTAYNGENRRRQL